MKKRLCSGSGLWISVLVVALSGSMVLAQEKFPSQPIRLIVAQGAGGTTDFVARIVQPPLQKSLGVSLVIENMVGGGGNTASAFVYKQKPDGYTLLMRKQPSMSGGEVAQKGKFETLKFVHVYNITGRNYLRRGALRIVLSNGRRPEKGVFIPAAHHSGSGSRDHSLHCGHAYEEVRGSGYHLRAFQQRI